MEMFAKLFLATFCAFSHQRQHEQSQSFPYTTPGALFRKSMLLGRDFLNSALGLYTENSVQLTYKAVCHSSEAVLVWVFCYDHV